jgi:hypothetical protein
MFRVLLHPSSGAPTVAYTKNTKIHPVGPLIEHIHYQDVRNYEHQIHLNIILPSIPECQPGT